jgi:hypothetical protein
MSEADVSNEGVSALELYGESYYASHCGPIPYDRSQPLWAEFFGNIADELVRTFRPRRAFDAGCALGFLVEALWDRGVTAYGRDISKYAISNARFDIRQYCSVGSLAQPIEGPFDLITCIEVVEHMTEEEGRTAIANMTAAADRIVFSSSPTDLTEPTHINVKPPIYWIQAFAAHDFAPLIETTLFSITPYALAFERRKAKPSDDFLYACAEIVRDRMKRAELSAQGRALAERTAESERTIASLVADRDRLAAEMGRALAEKTAASERALASLAADRDRLAADQVRLAADRDRLAAERDRVLDELATAAERSAAMKVSLREATDTNAHLYELVDQISRSRSWRVARELNRITRRIHSRNSHRDLARDLLAQAKASVPSFDREFYLREYPDVAEAGMDPLLHYLRHGRAEGRPSNALTSAGEAAPIACSEFAGRRDGPDVPG